jgi:hypothetical protein
MSEKLSALIEEFKTLLENGEDISPKAERRMLLALSIDTHTEVKTINGRLKKVEAAVEESERHPSLLWLLRFRTKKTVVIIATVFVLLSLFYISGTRMPILELLGLPSLTP